MAPAMDVERLERDAYRSRFDDGLIDLFAGLCLAWIGSCWLWIEDLAGLAGVLPAVFVVPFMMGRERFLETRAGYVRFAERRRSWERRTLSLIVLAGVAVFAAGIGAYLAFEAGGTARDAVEWVAPGLIAAILGAGAIGIGIVVGIGRFVAYGLVLIAAGVGAAIADANPGLPVLVGGAVATVWGAVLVVRFVRSHPRRAPEAP